MRESRTYGSVRGALSNERPYREQLRAVTEDVLALALALVLVLRNGTIDRIMAMSDVEIGLQALLASRR